MNVKDVSESGPFWASALEYSQQPHNPAFLVPREGQGPRIHLDQDDRTHLDLWVDTEEEQLAEVERLISLGASRVAWEYPTMRTLWSSPTQAARSSVSSI